MIARLRYWWRRRTFVAPEPLTETFCRHAYGTDNRCWFCGERR